MGELRDTPAVGEPVEPAPPSLFYCPACGLRCEIPTFPPGTLLVHDCESGDVRPEGDEERQAREARNRVLEDAAWFDVNSSTLDAVMHTSTLRVRFKNGSVYEYSGVPYELCLQLVGAESVGKAFHELIKGRFKHRRIDTQSEEAVE